MKKRDREKRRERKKKKEEWDFHKIKESSFHTRQQEED
jgi:hypothetical protein